MPTEEARQKRAQQFRERANELRNIAEAMAEEPARHTLLKIASDYERLALRAEAPGSLPDFTPS